MVSMKLNTLIAPPGKASLYTLEDRQQPELNGVHCQSCGNVALPPAALRLETLRFTGDCRRDTSTAQGELDAPIREVMRPAESGAAGLSAVKATKASFPQLGAELIHITRAAPAAVSAARDALSGHGRQSPDQDAVTRNKDWQI